MSEEQAQELLDLARRTEREARKRRWFGTPMRAGLLGIAKDLRSRALKGEG